MASVVENVREIVGGDADALAELERIADANDGDLDHEAVLEAARDEDSPLHKHFEWDDSVAAEKYRKHQARQLVQSYKLHTIEGGQERTVRYYTNVVIADKNVYRRTEDVLRIDSLREQQRLRLTRDLNRIRGELATWEGFAGAATAIQDAIDALAVPA